MPAARACIKPALMSAPDLEVMYEAVVGLNTYTVVVLVTVVDDPPVLPPLVVVTTVVLVPVLN
jgi:hypothetical protein